jgi:hypothetical protein
MTGNQKNVDIRGRARAAVDDASRRLDELAAEAAAVVDGERVYVKRNGEHPLHVASSAVDLETRCGLRTSGPDWAVAASDAEITRAAICPECMRWLETNAPSPRPSEIDTPLSPATAAQIAAAALGERVAIVAWLRRDPDARMAQAYADGIEAGEHLKGEG